jgi:hypothetical protein
MELGISSRLLRVFKAHLTTGGQSCRLFLLFRYRRSAPLLSSTRGRIIFPYPHLLLWYMYSQCYVIYNAGVWEESILPVHILFSVLLDPVFTGLEDITKGSRYHVDIPCASRGWKMRNRNVVTLFVTVFWLSIFQHKLFRQYQYCDMIRHNEADPFLLIKRGKKCETLKIYSSGYWCSGSMSQMLTHLPLQMLLWHPRWTYSLLGELSVWRHHLDWHFIAVSIDRGWQLGDVWVSS